jgi:hypothetical protein
LQQREGNAFYLRLSAFDFALHPTTKFNMPELQQWFQQAFASPNHDVAFRIVNDKSRGKSKTMRSSS